MSDRFVLRLGHSIMQSSGDIDGIIVEQEINPEVVSLKWSTDILGPATCQITLQRPGRYPAVGIIPPDIAIPEHAHVEIWNGASILWDGFVLDADLGGGGVVVALSSVGYMRSLEDIEWDNGEYTAGTSGDLMLRRMLAMKAPWLVPDAARWFDPQVTVASLEYYQGQSLAQIIEVIRNAGDIDHNPLWIMVRPGGTIVMEPRIAPSEPHYRIPFDSGRIQRWNRNYAKTARAVRVRFGPSSSPTSTGLAVNPDSASFRTVTLSAGDIGPDAANAMRDTELFRRSIPEVQATLGANRDSRTWLTVSGGQSVPWWEPVVGEWVAIAADPAVPIVAVTCDATNGTATYELGTRDLTLYRNQGLAQRQAAYRFGTQTAPAGGRMR